MQKVGSAAGDSSRREVALQLIGAPRFLKRAIVVLLDASLCVLATGIAIYLRLGFLPSPNRGLVFATILSVVLCLGVFWLGRGYLILFRYVSASTIRLLSRNIAIYAVPYAGVFTYYGIDGVPRTLGLLQPAILLPMIVIGRSMLAYGTSLGAKQHVGDLPNVLIYGSGSAGRQLLSAIRQSGDMTVAGFVDDDITLSGQMLDGLKVYRPTEVERIIKQKGVSDVLLAIPSATRKRRGEIVTSLSPSVNVRTLPGLIDLIHGRVKVSDLRELKIDDLLGRNKVAPDSALIRSNLAGRAVLVTGAGGSIGSELCRQIADNDPSILILLDHSEFALYTIHDELQAVAADEQRALEIVPVLGSVSDSRLLDRVFAQWRPERVFHAAAYKHVPLVEQNVAEAVQNNVHGTYHVARAAVKHGTANVVLVSTDKAVRPTSIMGTTKRLAEQILQGFSATQSATCFSMVRFGNVLGSSGSVVPRFRAQAHAGGPITITHREMTRYFMLIPEAAQLVIQAGAMAQGGEVFLLDMGEPVKILDLAYSVVALSGLTVRDAANPDGDIEIVEIGLRPGEKLYEELLIACATEPSEHPLIMKATEAHIPWLDLEPELANLKTMIKGHDETGIIAALQRLVPEFAGRRVSQESLDATP